MRRLIGGEVSECSADVARFFLDLSFTAEDRQRMAVLSERANDGDLSSDEREELSVYVLLADLLSLLKAEARASLKAHSPRA